MAADKLAPGNSLEALTEKQREVLELLLQHKTSKEIARILAISPHTVDQRIQFAKEKLGVLSRSDLAIEYLRLRSTYERLTYEESRILESALPMDKETGSIEERSLVLNHPERNGTDGRDEPEDHYRIIPQMFEGRYGTSMRIFAAILVAFLMILVVLGGLALFSETSEILGW